jgi:hypothetical protein
MTEAVDTPRLRKTLEWALSEHRKAERGEPSEWNQEEWLGTLRAATWNRLFTDTDMSPGETDRAVEQLNLSTACGTACCLAGKIVLDAGMQPASATGSDGHVVTASGVERSVPTVALELLGGDPEEVTRLFRGDNTIRDLYRIAGELTGGDIEMPAELAEATPATPLRGVRWSTPAARSATSRPPTPAELGEPTR